jgi:hypothetical protein
MACFNREERGRFPMPIKNLRFSFDIPLTQLLGLIASGNVDMKIDVTGTEPKGHKALTHANGVKLLTGPGTGSTSKNGQPRNRGRDANGQPVTAYDAIMKMLAAAPDHTGTLAELKPIVAALGLSESSASSQMNVMRRNNHAKRLDKGTYQLTKNGLAEAKKRNLIGEQPHA